MTSVKVHMDSSPYGLEVHMDYSKKVLKVHMDTWTHGLFYKKIINLLKNYIKIKIVFS